MTTTAADAVKVFTAADVPAWVSLMTECFDAPGPAVHHGLARVEGVTRLVVRAWDSVVAVAERDERSGSVRVGVRPDRRGRGVGRRLASDVCSPSANGIDLATAVRDDDPRSLLFAQQQGFQVAEHSLGFELALAGVREQRPLPADLELRSLPARPTGEAWAAAYRAFATCCRDTPDLHGRLPDLEEFQGLLAEPTAGLVAYLQEAPVACCFAVPESERCWRIILTGVAPAHRQRGLGLAIKSAMEQRAQDAGVTSLRTNNLATNEPVLALNRKLGYRPRVGLIRLKTQLSPPRASRQSG